MRSDDSQWSKQIRSKRRRPTMSGYLPPFVTAESIVLYSAVVRGDFTVPSASALVPRPRSNSVKAKRRIVPALSWRESIIFVAPECRRTFSIREPKDIHWKERSTIRAALPWRTRR